MARPGQALLATGAALLFCLLWSAAYVAAKVALRDLPPLTLLALRFGLAGLALGLTALACGATWPGRAVWPRVIGLGLLTNAIYLGMTFHALQHLSAGLAAVIASTNPLLLALVAPFTIGERPSRTTLLGLALGFIGVVGVMLPRLGTGQDSLGGALLTLIAVGALVAGTITFKRLPSESSLLAVTAGQLLAAAVAVLPFALLFEHGAAGPLHPETVSALLFLALGVSVGGSLIWFWLLANGEATRVSAWYFLTPVLGIALGSLLLGERFGLAETPGLLAVMAGIVLANRK